MYQVPDTVAFGMYQVPDTIPDTIEKAVWLSVPGTAGNRQTAGTTAPGTKSGLQFRQLLQRCGDIDVLRAARHTGLAADAISWSSMLIG